MIWGPHCTENHAFFDEHGVKTIADFRILPRCGGLIARKMLSTPELNRGPHYMKFQDSNFQDLGPSMHCTVNLMIYGRHCAEKHCTSRIRGSLVALEVLSIPGYTLIFLIGAPDVLKHLQNEIHT